MEVITTTSLSEAPLKAREKSRDIYLIAEETLLVIYTDRLEAHDVAMREPIPYKGVMHNQITNFWMSKFAHFVGNYRITSKLDDYPQLKTHKDMLAGRSLLGRDLKRLPMRFLVVGGLGGNLWKEYQETGRLNGHYMVKGLEESEWMEQPVVVPLPRVDASQSGGDGRKWAQRLLGQKLYAQIEERCLAVFGVARNYAAARGLTLADTSLDFGMAGHTPLLMHELLTPDTSTYWPGDILPGESKTNYERQNLYGWLRIQRWQPDQPQPDLPQQLLQETLKKYKFIYEVMTGKVATLKQQEAEEDAAAEVCSEEEE